MALPLAFAVTFAAGVAMERLVIRHLYHRPLETLLATFGISIALQQLAKNIFGTQARPLTSPAWLDGALVINDIVSISYIRIAIFVLALIFLGVFLFIMKRTRLGLEVRAVTQNPRMAASMGINPDRINMLTFGLGSGIAGVAGVAIGLFAKVTSELGQDYIVQSFMTVVVGGVGNIWGTLAGGHDDRLPAEGDRVPQPVEHARRADLHDHLHHHLHPVPPQGHHRPQGPRGGGLSMPVTIFCSQVSRGVRGAGPPAPPPEPGAPMTRTSFVQRHPSVLIFLGLLALFTLAVTLMSEAYGAGPDLHLLRQDAGQDALPLPRRPRDGPRLGLHAASCRSAISPSSGWAAT